PSNSFPSRSTSRATRTAMWSRETRAMRPRSPISGPSRATRARAIPTGRSSRPAARTEAPRNAPSLASPAAAALRIGVSTSFHLCVLLILAALAACEVGAPPAPERLTLERAEFADLPGWREDKLGDALPALRRSCAKLLAQPEAAVPGPEEAPTWLPRLRAACAALPAVAAGDENAARSFLERWFLPYRATTASGPEGLFTGYYEPELSGSRQRGGGYAVPLYGEPKDLVTVDLGAFDDSLKGKHVTGRVVGHALLPYPTRSEIEAGALEDKAKELLWLADPIDAFFLQIQGSGRVVLEDGSVVHIGYAAANGRRYQALGKLLAERGAMSLDEVSLASLKAWLRAHPGEAKALMDENASYVFFREIA